MFVVAVVKVLMSFDKEHQLRLSAAPPADEPTIAASTGAAASRNDPSVLPKNISAEYVEMKSGGCTEIQEMRFLRQYVGKWMELDLQVISLSDEGTWLRAICWPKAKATRREAAVVVYFERKWEDHLQHLKKGDTVRVRTKISAYKGKIVLDYSEPIQP